MGVVLGRGFREDISIEGVGHDDLPLQSTIYVLWGVWGASVICSVPCGHGDMAATSRACTPSQLVGRCNGWVEKESDVGGKKMDENLINA
jgi:hypothetical protein